MTGLFFIIIKMARIQIALSVKYSSVQALKSKPLNRKVRDLGDFRGNRETSLDLLLYITDSCHKPKNKNK